MEKKCFSIKNFYLLPGLLISLIILIVIITIFIFLVQINSQNLVQINKESILFYIYYFIKIFTFSLKQAFLSTFIIILASIFISISLNRKNFIFKKLLINLCNIILILPVLISVICIINIYGKEGWLAKILKLFDINYNFSIYGLTGIIITHAFFNIPLAVSILIKQLKLIPIEQIYIAENLHIKGWNYFLLIEWQHLKIKLKSLIIMIFVLCFSSLTTILILGGGPQNTTIEVAIFHALSYEYNFTLAVSLSIFKMLFCLLLMLMFKHNDNQYIHYEYNEISYVKKNSRLTVIIDFLSILILTLIIVPPITSIIFDGLFNHNLNNILKDINFWHSIINSLIIAIISGVFSTIIGFILTFSIKEYFFKKYYKISNFIEYVNILIFSMPSIIFATGLFVILNSYIKSYEIYFLIIITNIITNIPLIIKMIKPYFFDISLKYNNLCSSLNIKLWYRFKLIELKILKKPISQALSISCIQSIGDINIISLFGNQDLHTITFYLFQQISSYQNKQAMTISLILIILCILIFKIIEKIFRKI